MNTLKKIQLLSTCSTILLIIAVISQTTAEIPDCPYEDTINITGSQRLENGTFRYKEKYIIPSNLTDWYEHELVFGNQIEKVEKHLRGCICKIYACVQLCCGTNQLKTPRERQCYDTAEPIKISPYINIMHDNETEKTHHIFEEFAIQNRLPCSIGIPQKDFQLFENGTILSTYGMDGSPRLFSKHEYCMINITSDTSQVIYAPMLCFGGITDEELPKNFGVSYTAMIISIPCLLITIFVYAIIPELRNMHGKCLVCYLSALTMSFILLTSSNTINKFDGFISDSVCEWTGLTTYFFVVAAFLWLAVISFDLWYNFRSTKIRVSRATQQRRFNIYFIFAWSLPFLLTCITLWGQHSIENYELRPGIGEENCWFDMRRWSPMIFLYGPMIIILIFNLAVFILTTLQIYKVQKELSQFDTKGTANNRHLNAEKDAYSMYLRLFVIMGINWLFEILSYLNGENIFFYITDFFNAITGVIIFILFVIKRKVLMLIKKRCMAKNPSFLKLNRRNQLSTRSASKTEMSGVSLTQDTDV